MLWEIFRRLSHFYGPQHWWPARTRLEVIAGAILVQNTAWTNVEKALANLKAARILNIQGLTGASENRLAQLIRPSGYFNQKTRKLKAFLGFLHECYGGSLHRMAARDLPALRQELLAIRGIGAETADSILLYAFQKKVFVVDAYTRRLLERHGWRAEGVSYEQLRSLIEKEFQGEVSQYNEFHALFVRVGKDYCRKIPCCSGCPLEPILTESQRQELLLEAGIS